MSFSENSMTSTKSNVTDFDVLSMEEFRGRISEIMEEAELAFGSSGRLAAVLTFWISATCSVVSAGLGRSGTGL